MLKSLFELFGYYANAPDWIICELLLLGRNDPQNFIPWILVYGVLLKHMFKAILFRKTFLNGNHEPALQCVDVSMYAKHVAITNLPMQLLQSYDRRPHRTS